MPDMRSVVTLPGVSVQSILLAVIAPAPVSTARELTAVGPDLPIVVAVSCRLK